MKPTVIDPKTTTRASAFDLWMHVLKDMQCPKKARKRKKPKKTVKT